MNLSYSRAMNLARATSRSLVYISIAGFLVSLYLAASGYYIYHGYLMFEVVVPLFVYGVAISYVSSSLKSTDVGAPITVLYLAASGWLLAVMGFVSMAMRSYLALSIAALVSSAGPLAASIVSSLQSDVKLSDGLIGVYFLVGGLMMYLVRLTLFREALLTFVTFGLGPIYAVSVHSFPSTFRERPNLPLAALDAALLIVAAALSYYYRYFMALVGVSAITFPLSIGVQRSRRFIESAKRVNNPIARAGTLYFIDGHIIASIMLACVGLTYIVGSLLGLSPLVALHALALGVLVTFVILHAPLMLPVILRWTSARRYNLTPFLSEAAATAIWPFNEHVSFFFLGLAVVFLVLIVKPTRQPLPFSL